MIFGLKNLRNKRKSKRFFALIFGACLVFFLAVGTVGAEPTPSLEGDTNLFLPASQGGGMVYAPVKVDGRILFLVAAEASNGQGMMKGSMSPIESRAQAIERMLYRTINRGFDAETLKITNKVENKYADILLSDGKTHNNLSLLVYSEMDARISGYTLQEASDYVTYVVYRALIRAQIEHKPAYLLQQGLVASGIIGVGILISLCLQLFQKRLMRRWRSLKERQGLEMQKLQSVQSIIDFEDEESDASTNEMMSQQMSFKQILNRYDLYRHLLQLGHILVWLIGIAWIVGLFPYTRWLQVFAIQQPILLGVFLGTNLVTKYSEVLIDRLLSQWATRESLTAEATARWSLRVSSFSPILKVMVAILLVGLALIFVLFSLGIPLAPVLAGAGILGFAISLGSQTLVKDLIAGALILIEDQYAIGDFVNLNNSFGRVEKMNLRITSLRSKDGSVIIIPNSEIRIVQNLSKNWSRVKLFVYIDYETDIGSAYSVLQAVIDEIKTDEFWGSQIVEAEIRGMEAIDSGGFTIGVRFETKPGAHRKLIKEYRRRMKLAFDRAGIKLGSPLTTIQSKSESVMAEKSEQAS